MVGNAASVTLIAEPFNFSPSNQGNRTTVAYHYGLSAKTVSLRIGNFLS